MISDKDIDDIEETLKEKPMDDKTPWTSIDLYYKGFHVKKSVPEQFGPAKIIETVEAYLKAGFKPSWNEDTNKSANGSKPTTQPAKACPKCEGEMWDNRPKKITGEFNPAAPDFKCRDKACGGVIWPPKNKPMQADGSSYKQ